LTITQKIKLKLKDLIFAKGVCADKQIKATDVIPPIQNVSRVSARSIFVDIYSDSVMNIARYFNKYSKIDDNSYITVKGSMFLVTDDIMDTYLWLLKEGFKKCCLFQGKEGAPLEHYINAVLRSRFTKIDYIRHKTGINTNVPKCISALGKSYKEMYLLLRQNQAKSHICSKLDLDSIEYNVHKNEIIEALYADGKEDLLIETTIEEFSDSFAKYEKLDANELQLINRFTEEILPNVLKILPKSEIRFMIEYWGQGNSVQSIFDTFNIPPFRKYLKELNVKNPQDFYKTIEQLIKEIKEEIRGKYPKVLMAYPNIDIKSMLSVYFRNWISELELENENEKS